MLSNCTHDNPIPKTPFENANFATEGIMYGRFWSPEAKFNQNDPNIDIFKNNADFFRCKQCHAWDGLGNLGSYIDRSPNITRPNVAALNFYEMAIEHSPQELFDALKETTGRRDISYDLSQYDPDSNSGEGDKKPNFPQILTDTQIWDIAKFAKEGMFDVNQLYDATYSGDVQPFFDEKCINCHGANNPNLESPDSYQNIIDGGHVDTADPPNSSLYTVLNGFMGSNVTDGEKAMILNWVEEGAKNN